MLYSFNGYEYKGLGGERMTYEQEVIRSVFDAYIGDIKAVSNKDRPTVDMLEKVKNKAIKALEQPTRKVGKWILHEENSASSSYHCSVCNRLINVLWNEELSDYSYCHCGAEMVGIENGSN